MPLEILTIPCLSDNYAFLAREPGTDSVALVDAPEAGPILKTLADRNWKPSTVLITHHHDDHVEGLAEILAAYPAQVIGAASDRHRLPPLDHAVVEGDTVAIGSEAGTVIDVSGHTVGHIAYHFPGARAVFTADSLMALGCGRVFEGTAAMMWASLCKLAALPAETMVYSGHEYTQSNAKFALTVEPDNAALRARVTAVNEARANGHPTVPARLGDELATNPFLRAGLPEVKALLGMENAPDAEVFGEIRARKDRF